MIIIRILFFYVVFCSSAIAATITHGPMLGHTTDTTVRVWVRADGPCDFYVRAIPKQGGMTILSETIRLVKVDNFCGSVQIEGLSPLTTYTYSALLDNEAQPLIVVQEFKTFPKPGEPGIVRIGFGHSIRGKGEQMTWRAIASKKPDLFILMGDNIYSDSTDPSKQRRMYLEFRADPHFRAFGATTPIYAVWDDHDYGKNNSDRTQPGKERSLKTFNEIWPNPPSQAQNTPGIWTRFTVGQAELFLLDGRYHRSPNIAPDGPEKTMLGAEQRAWFMKVLTESKAVFKLPVSGSSWNCGGPESWNHSFTYEYDTILKHIAEKRTPGIILLGGDRHQLSIGVRPRESWGGYDLHEWMAGQIWNYQRDLESGYVRAFGLITLNTESKPGTARLEFINSEGKPQKGQRLLYTTIGALRALFNSPPGVTGIPEKHVGYIDRFRPITTGPMWDSLPRTTGETITEEDIRFPEEK